MGVLIGQEFTSNRDMLGGSDVSALFILSRPHIADLLWLSRLLIVSLRVEMVGFGLGFSYFAVDFFFSLGVQSCFMRGRPAGEYVGGYRDFVGKLSTFFGVRMLSYAPRACRKRRGYNGGDGVF